MINFDFKCDYVLQGKMINFNIKQLKISNFLCELMIESFKTRMHDKVKPPSIKSLFFTFYLFLNI